MRKTLLPSILLSSILLLPFGSASFAAASPAAEGGEDFFRIAIRDAGVFRVTWEDLAQVGLDRSVASDQLRLEHLGEPAPIWIEDGGDGSFDPGDSFEFLGDRLPGKNAYYHEFSRENIYLLHLRDTPASETSRMRSDDGAAEAPAESTPWWRFQHLEEDRLLARLRDRARHDGLGPEPWFWTKLTQMNPKPFSLPVDLSDLATDRGATLDLHVYVRGLSNGARRLPEIKDHRLVVRLNGERLTLDEWDGLRSHRVAAETDASSFKVGENEITLHLQRRFEDPEEKNVIIDVVMLNYLEIRSPSTGRIADRQRPLWLDLEETLPGTPVAVRSTASDLKIYTRDGARIAPTSIPQDGDDERLFAFLAPETDEIHFVPDGDLHPPLWIDRGRATGLKNAERQADYLMIGPDFLLQEIEPLAQAHRERGLRVETVELQHVFNEFSHGIFDPRALKEFIRHAYHEWQDPAPRWVLLVGDASWDTKNTTVELANYASWSSKNLHAGQERFWPRKTTTYADGSDLNRRNLVPTWNYASSEGHSASDNWFVTVDGDDEIPDLAIGRIPVVEPEEVRAVVDKTLRYLRNPKPGPWRRDILWITNEEAQSQRRTDILAESMETQGFRPIKVYPKPEEKDNVHHQSTLREAFDEGPLLVHFYGHGGRNIWRTGPPDFKKNHDLFTLEDLDLLETNERLPIILSMTCFSAPFDHPNADSIGEKFLRLPDRGAVAVLGASWRNAPTTNFSVALLEGLMKEDTIGEAVQAAKGRIGRGMLVATYNLLGDPALPAAKPQESLELTVERSDQAIEIASDLAAGFTGTALIEWLDGEGRVIRSSEETVQGDRFSASFSGSAEDRAQVETFRVYLWDPETGRDAAGALRLPIVESPAETSP